MLFNPEQRLVMNEGQSTRLAELYIGALQASEAKDLIINEGFAWIEDAHSVRDVDDMRAEGFGVSQDVFLSPWNAIVKPGPVRDICRTFFDSPVLTTAFVRAARKSEIQRPSTFFLESCEDTMGHPTALGVQIWTKDTVIFVRREQITRETNNTEAHTPTLVTEPKLIYMPEGGVSFTWLPERLAHMNTTTLTGIECIKGLGLYGSLTSRRDAARCKLSFVGAEGEVLRRLQDTISGLKEEGLEVHIEAVTDSGFDP